MMDMAEIIIENKVRCLICMDEIQSFTSERTYCSCGNVWTCGGFDFVDQDALDWMKMEDLSEILVVPQSVKKRFDLLPSGIKYPAGQLLKKTYGSKNALDIFQHQSLWAS